MRNTSDLTGGQCFDKQQQLGGLAMRYRGATDKSDRDEVVKEYGQLVESLIDSGCWTETPAPEDQLPDDVMPKSFFDYWERQAK